MYCLAQGFKCMMASRELDPPVYYCSYGSNLTRRRFLGYIEGGRVPFNSASFRGATDKTHPSDSFVSRIAYPLTFACKSMSWGGGGVAYLHPGVLPPDRISHDGAIVRCYRVKFSQWRDVVEQENGDADLSTVLTADVVQRLTASGVGASLQLPQRSWYSRLLYLGDHKGIPMLTFSCPEGFLDEHGFNIPSRGYASALVAGLVEAGALPPAAAISYIRHATGLQRAREWLAEGAERVSVHTAPKWLDGEGGITALAIAIAEWLEPSSAAAAAVREWASAHAAAAS